MVNPIGLHHAEVGGKNRPRSNYYNTHPKNKWKEIK
jgi:hypothetical protein